MTSTLLAGYFVLAAVAGLKPEAAERNAFTAEIRALIQARNFSELERIAAALIKDDPRYTCGVSKLVDFYTAMDPSSMGGPEGPDDKEAVFKAWAEQKPESYLPSAGLSLVELWRAGMARGGRPARNTTKEQWSEHDRHSQLAMEWGKKALARDPRDPALYSHMIGVCRGADCSVEDARRWLEAALAINPRFDGAIIPMANFLLPRWRGSSDELVAFAEWVSDTYPEIGNVAYARIATVGLLIEEDQFRHVYPSMSWDRIRAGLREIDKRYPDSARTYHLLARFAMLFDDRTTAREAWSKLDGAWNADARQYWDSPAAYGAAGDWARQGTAKLGVAR